MRSLTSTQYMYIFFRHTKKMNVMIIALTGELLM